MRKAQKQEVLEFITSLHQAHEEMKKALHQKEYGLVQNMLTECQEFAVVLGENIEKTEGEGHIAVAHVENYCETLFGVFEKIGNGQVNENKIYKILRKQLLAVENSVKNDIAVKKEVVFFPYKASMWDSLESIYLAAKEDPDCDAYCVPIPYYDLNPDRSFRELHDEKDEYPDNIEITDWQSYHFEERRPDVVYIHNPYDGCNLVTSVHPRFYSSNLKKFTDLLVYVPYYSTSGGMNEAQSLCPAYLYADYIVIQSPKFRAYFDGNLPDRKFLPFGSPKFDRVVKHCKNPPKPSAEWETKMTGKDGRRRRVFFYNTSINGMLADTENFLKKMEYVFKCFKGREDVCLLWRPHPLLETTFDSMRPQYRPVYEMLKKSFIDNNLGIYDETPDIADAIALSDAYIGDVGTSVTSLFGIVGKPIFILDRRIHSKPDAQFWQKKINFNFNCFEQGRFVVTQQNQLYISEGGRYDYRYLCNLSDCGCRHREYALVWEVNGKKYACPVSTQDILVIGNEGVEKRVRLKKEEVAGRTFIDSWKYGRFLVLLPLNYPAVVRYDTVTEECAYFKDNINMFVKEKDGQKISGASWLCHGMLYIASPVDNVICRFDIESGETQTVTLPVNSRCGCSVMAEYMGQIWMLPYAGKTVVRWDLQTGEIREYDGFPEGFTCINPRLNQECEEQPFSSMAFYEGGLYLTPRWANMYLRLDIHTGQFTRWEPPFGEEAQENRKIWNKGAFPWPWPEDERGWIKIYSNVNKRLYNVNIGTDECEEIDIKFDMKGFEELERGFGECSETLKYACTESTLNSLDRFLDGTTAGSPFDREKQLEAYKDMAANSDGSCGKKVYEYIKGQG